MELFAQEESRSLEIINRDLNSSRRSIDRLFAALMILQLVAAVVTALVVSPMTWVGTESKVHFHVWAALGLGSLLVSMPVYLTCFYPGTAISRNVIAISQMLFASLFIHLSGGRIETHFHIFVSLAFLAFYRDWKVLATATIITSADHFTRGFFWPQSVFGVLTASPWRSVEHASWVLLEDLILLVAGLENLRSLQSAACREAELEFLNIRFEDQVRVKTREAVAAKESAEATLYEITALRFAMDQHSLLSVTDCSGVIIHANDELCRISGYSQDELQGQDYRILNSEFHSATFWADMWSAIERGEPWRNDVCNRKKDGSLFWGDYTITPQLNAQGRPEKYISLGFDITDKKNAESTLKDANERFRTLAAAVEHSPDAIVITRLNGIVQFANPAAQRLDNEFGYKLGPGAPALVFAHGWIDDQTKELIVETVLSNRVYNGLIECNLNVRSNFLEFGDRKSISPPKLLSVTASPLVSENGEIEGVLLAKRDVTEEIVRQRALEELTTAMDAASDCVFIFDAETMQFVYANQGATKQVGYDLSEMRSMTPLDIKPQFSSSKFQELLDTCEVHVGSAIQFRTEHRHRDGHCIPVDVSLQYMPQLGRKGRFFAVVRDITAQLASDKALELAIVQAETASRSKSEFLANMSHEIRTPLTAILGFADLLDSDGDFSRTPCLAANAVQTIRSNANHLLEIINDILDMSKIEAGRVTIERILFSPTQIVNEVASLMRPRAIGKGISVHLKYEGKIPSKIESDPTRLRQILLNLLGNAIKFTEVGSITLHTAFLSEQNLIQFRVVDTGIGMTVEQRDLIARFDAFSQADGTTTRQFGGTGLGLRISNSLAEMLGGHIEIESRKGHGSTFVVTISAGNISNYEFNNPVLESTQREVESKSNGVPVQAEANVSLLRGLKILLAEDGPDNQRLIAFHLKKAGATVTIAENGRIALELIERNPQEFDLVFMDMQMPEMDGYEATRRLRIAGHKLPIIALTAHAMDGDRQKCLDAGCNDYTTKPINRQLLIGVAERHGKRTVDPISNGCFVSNGIESCDAPVASN